jgi:RNA polymerase sigma-70 factor (ECF subfamily)
MSPWVRVAMAVPHVARGWKDELLGLLFACCHPALEPGESAALALATVIGLSTAEIAQAFVVAPRSMEQRLTRARTRLREQGDYEAPRGEDARDRLGAVLTALHLLFNEGYWSTDDEAPIRGDLCGLAIGLARSLREVLPDQPEVAGLLALFVLHEARRPARLDSAGAPTPLPDQDRTRWDRALIDEGTAELERALAAGRPGPFQTEAAISAVHCRAATAADTDWSEIAALYALLERMRPTPAVRINRAFAVSRAEGPAAGLALLAGTPEMPTDDYPYAHLVRGVLLDELGRRDEAIAALEHAKAGARNSAEAAQIEERLRRARSG